MFSKTLIEQAKQLRERAKEADIKIATAESCTGGLIASLITSVSGSADIFEYGFVTYANDAKQHMIGVPATILKANGAVSAEVAEAMAKGALKKSKADIAVSVTGIAGPTGGTREKPVGLVYIGIATKKNVKSRRFRFKGNRQQVRLQSVKGAMELLIASLPE